MICQSNSPALKAENPIEMTVVDFHLAGAKQKRLIILQWEMMGEYVNQYKTRFRNFRFVVSLLFVNNAYGY